MDPGARADRRTDGRVDARRHGGQLALKPALLGVVLALGGSAGSAATPGAGALSAAQVPTAAGAAAPAYAWHLPRGFPTPAVPADNPMSDSKVALGERLFFDTRLSSNGRYSCASCHDPARSFSDGRKVAIGATGAALPHNAMALVNVAYNLSFGWTRPRVTSLEAQMLQPLLNQHPVELGVAGREQALCAQLASDPQYAAAFAEAFPPPPEPAAPGPGAPATSPVTFTHLVRAIAAFERTLISGRSPFDAYVFGGEHAAMPAEAKRGMALFFSQRVGCARCHSGFNFAGNWRDSQGATGPASFANNGTSTAPVRVPTLRNIALTAPYMHDGRFATLDEVLGHYSGLARRRSAGERLDSRLPHTPLSDSERAELHAFLDSLTDESFVRNFAARTNVH
jgi:cytochrome c peroxidase